MNRHKQQRIGLSVAQMGPVHLSDPKSVVVERMISLLQEASKQKANIVVFPELALTTFFPRYWMSQEHAVKTYFESNMPNDTLKPLFESAKSLSIGFYLGYAEVTADGDCFNTSILVNSSGHVVGKYRKVHLPGHSDYKSDVPFQHLEKKYFKVGNLGFPVFYMINTKIGMCICNDRRWPETYRVMALNKAEVVLLGYNTPSVNIYWDEPLHLRTTTHLLVLQANAYQNGLWIAAAAKCGSEDGHHMIGSSVIVAPTGEIVARAITEQDELISVNADLSIGRNFRDHVFNFEKHRRPENYKIISRTVYNS